MCTMLHMFYADLGFILVTPYRRVKSRSVDDHCDNSVLDATRFTRTADSGNCHCFVVIDCPSTFSCGEAAAAFGLAFL